MYINGHETDIDGRLTDKNGRLTDMNGLKNTILAIRLGETEV